MAGGTFISQNKIRPGAYINFKSISKPSGKVGIRGISTIPIVLGWGPNDQLIEINSSDLSDGKILDKLGYYGYENEIVSIKEALKNSYKCLVFRVDSNGQKATATIDSLNIVAKYPGTVGNRLSVSIKDVENDKFEVKTFLDTKVVDVQLASNIDELLGNCWVDFAGSGKLVANAGIKLTSGFNGTESIENYSRYIDLINNKYFNTMGVYTTNKDVKEKITTFIKQSREEKGKKIQCVINDFSEANYEGVISVDQGYKTKDTTVGVNGFVGYVTGLTSGASLNKSNTYTVIPGAVEIINPKTDDEIKEGIRKGKFIITFRQDESVVVETDINTFTDFSSTKSRDFCKNRVIRTLDDINNSIKNMFEKTYLGKINNNEDGRTSFKSDIISYLKELNKLGAIEDFKNEDISISVGNEIDSVLVDIGIKPIDAMEKLYMTVSVG
ncbi:phage tail sheath C-terminal domain-containing protein [Paraclostridium sordellii]|uniref:phage tail sheath C-terminal domain-containing protein n=1 Tax=Paraclostridium sordellii TaxID=1505 RepID=UPI0005E27131|nr:phage tail sheath C-terminal domain-containing protein [Paeniclostridium sordellii]MDU6247306.1 phage tail sheath C-terminal domain-containing protein [Paeniclostridium sordellii]MVO70956.1 phage tail protein [Paeniclostridium sordellii]CEO27146.1 phage protein [[Clostridium] sordellii] [Paeniclostridium sordellii]CEP42850.1 phage protein [[Clostridium] sordellii] [Paeniclostridium sordellii]